MPPGAWKTLGMDWAAWKGEEQSVVIVSWLNAGLEASSFTVFSLSLLAVMVDWGLFPRYRPSLTLSSSTNFSSLRVEEGGDGPKLFRIRGAVTWLTGRLRSRYLLLQEREQREFFSPLLFRLIRKERKSGKGTKKKHLGSSALSDLGFPLFSSSFAWMCVLSRQSCRSFFAVFSLSFSALRLLLVRISYVQCACVFR